MLLARLLTTADASLCTCRSYHNPSDTLNSVLFI